MVKFNKRLWAALLAGVMAVGLFLSQSGGVVYAAEADDITEIDLTDLYTGAEVSHNCAEYLKNEFNDMLHWKECGVCGKKYDEEAHNLETLGIDTCQTYASNQSEYCKDGCGYTKELPKRKHTQSEIYQIPSWHDHRTTCIECGQQSWSEKCHDANGTVLGCNAVGTCVVCGYTYEKTDVSYIFMGRCIQCGEKFFDLQVSTSVVDEYTTHVEWVLTPLTNITSSMETNRFANFEGMDAYISTSNQQAYFEGGKYYYKADFTAAKDAPFTKYLAEWRGTYTYNGYTKLNYFQVQVNADNYAPVFENVKLEGNGSESQYSKKARIYVDVKDEFESLVNMVSMRLLDEDGSIISDWGSSVRNGTIYSKTFDIVAEANGKKVLTLEAKDLIGNVISRQIEIRYLDSKSPTMISEKVSSPVWSKSKKITFSCTDEGVGNVEIAFNDLSDFKIADYNNGIYSRSYSFIGEVYGEVTGAVYFRDGAGNITSEFVKIYNLDNTEPVIENVSVDDALDSSGSAIGWNISVSGNDNNDNLDREGGGIIGYAVTSDDMVPDESAYKGESSIFIPKSGTYYVWIKDAAGNVRESQAITILTDIYFNGIPISNSELNGKKIRDVFFNGKRLRL